MKIVNPLYDKAFKYLMENNRLAKKVLGVILETEILELTLEQQETVVPDEKRGFILFRLDFKAVIRKEDGSKEKVLVELQKSKFDTDIKRFRNYLGANYISKPEKKEENKPSQNEDYPIVTIYILGYKLDDLPYLAVTVNNQIIDSVSKNSVEVDSFFVKMLTHRSHILQVKRLPKERKSRLEKFMTLFNQAWYADKKYILDLEEVPEEFRDIAEYLQLPVLDEEFRRQLEAEEEIDNIFDQQEAKYLKKIANAEAKAELERQNAEKERQNAELERQEKIEMIKNMKNNGMTNLQISQITGKTEQEIEELLD